jgi:RimJ/RimL family protein N-acetyltransferase
VREDLKLEPLRPEDEATLSALFAANDQPPASRWFDPFPLAAATAHALCHHRGRDLYWGVWDRSDMVGFAMVRGWDGGHEHRALGVLVDHRCRGRGIGKTATALMLAEVRLLGEDELRARVHDDNERSLRMLRANGFEEVQRGDGRVILRRALDEVAAAANGRGQAG